MSCSVCEGRALDTPNSRSTPAGVLLADLREGGTVCGGGGSLRQALCFPHLGPGQGIAELRVRVPL